MISSCASGHEQRGLPWLIVLKSLTHDLKVRTTPLAIASAQGGRRERGEGGNGRDESRDLNHFGCFCCCEGLGNSVLMVKWTVEERPGCFA